MGFDYARTPCFFCQQSGADITIIISPDPLPAKQFRPFLDDAHDSCLKKWERTKAIPSTAKPLKPIITVIRIQ